MFRKALVRNSTDEKCILPWADLLIFQKFSDFEHFSDGFLLSDFLDFHFFCFKHASSFSYECPNYYY